jgi:catechol 2,3-dioxygenase-like lactoylglutathione lyase family enzyme
VIKTQGLTHIHLIVRNLERSLHFYQEVFGMRERFRDGDAMAFLNTPGSQDSITLNEDPSRLDVVGQSGGIAHFGFRLANKLDLNTAVQEVGKFGGKLLSRGEHAPGVAYAYVADLDGYVIEL